MKHLVYLPFTSTLNSKRISLPGVDGNTVAVISNAEVIFQPVPDTVGVKVNATIAFQRAAFGGILQLFSPGMIFQLHLAQMHGSWATAVSPIPGYLGVIHEFYSDKQVYDNEYYLVSTANVALGIDCYVEIQYEVKNIDDILFIVDNLV